MIRFDDVLLPTPRMHNALFGALDMTIFSSYNAFVTYTWERRRPFAHSEMTMIRIDQVRISNASMRACYDGHLHYVELFDNLVWGVSSSESDSIFNLCCWIDPYDWVYARSW